MIIESNYNLSLAAEKLHISQPALSNLITRFEKNENVDLFIRRNGRLVSLTNAGEILYKQSKQIINIYAEMMWDIDKLSHHHSGVIRIGIPPLINSVLFTEIVSQFILLNSNIKFEILEHGAYKLIDEIENNNLDIAIILHPNYINLKEFHEVILFEDELRAFINVNHPLAQKTDSVTWNDISKSSLAIFDKEFMIHHHIMNKLKFYNLVPNIAIESSSWDFIVSMAREAGTISILPGPSQNYTNVNNLVILPIEDPIPWKVSLVYAIKDRYTLLETYIIESIKSYFINHDKILSIEDFEMLS